MTSNDLSGAGTVPTITVEVPNSDRRLRDAYTAIFSRSFVRVLPYYIWAVCFYAFVVFVSLVSPKRLFTAGNLEILVVIVLLAFLSLVWVPAWRARLDKPNELVANIPTVWRFTATRVAPEAPSRASGTSIRWPNGRRSAFHAICRGRRGSSRSGSQHS